jgi:hypothetical protein
MKSPAIVGLAVALWAGQAQAQAISGNQFLGWCENAAEYVHCLGYVEGVVDGYNDVGAFYHPKGVTYNQATKIVIAYAHANPQLRHEQAWKLVLASQWHHHGECRIRRRYSIVANLGAYSAREQRRTIARSVWQRLGHCCCEA